MTTAAELVAAANEAVEACEPAEVARRIADTDTVVVDVREHDELTSGGLPEAIHLPRGLLEFLADPANPTRHERLRPDRPVLLYCQSGGRSALAASTLQQLGYAAVSHLRGGVAAWTQAGYALDNVATSTKGATR